MYGISQALAFFLDIDRIETKTSGDYTYVTFSTTCLRGKLGETLSKIKMRLFMLFDVPVKIAEVHEQKLVQSNPLFSQYIITMKVPKEARFLRGK